MEAAMKKNMRTFFASRAEDLAFIHLTRRDDLVVNRVQSPEAGVDFLVTVTRHGEPTGRMFGVQVKAREGSVRHGDDLDGLLGTPRARSVADAPFPFCVFVFTMDDDRGYYGWLKEPVLGARRSPSLRPLSQVGWDELDGAGLTRIVESVDSWYDAQHHPQAA
jgi:hypothetical protein